MVGDVQRPAVERAGGAGRRLQQTIAVAQANFSQRGHCAGGALRHFPTVGVGADHALEPVVHPQPAVALGVIPTTSCQATSGRWTWGRAAGVESNEASAGEPGMQTARLRRKPARARLLPAPRADAEGSCWKPLSSYQSRQLTQTAMPRGSLQGGRRIGADAGQDDAGAGDRHRRAARAARARDRRAHREATVPVFLGGVTADRGTAAGAGGRALRIAGTASGHCGSRAARRCGECPDRCGHRGLLPDSHPRCDRRLRDDRPVPIADYAEPLLGARAGRRGRDRVRRRPQTRTDDRRARPTTAMSRPIARPC